MLLYFVVDTSRSTWHGFHRVHRRRNAAMNTCMETSRFKTVAVLTTARSTVRPPPVHYDALTLCVWEEDRSLLNREITEPPPPGETHEETEEEPSGAQYSSPGRGGSERERACSRCSSSSTVPKCLGFCSLRPCFDVFSRCTISCRVDPSTIWPYYPPFSQLPPRSCPDYRTSTMARSPPCLESRRPSSPPPSSCFCSSSTRGFIVDREGGEPEITFVAVMSYDNIALPIVCQSAAYGNGDENRNASDGGRLLINQPCTVGERYSQ